MDPIRQANFTPLPHTVAIGDDATVLFLLETGADPEQRDAEGRSALTLAVENGHLKSVAYLLEYGANATAVDGTGKSPLQLAKDNGLAAAFNMLTGSAVENHKEHHASSRRKPQTIKRKSRLSTIRTIMLWAVGTAIALGAFVQRSAFNSNASQTIFESITSNDLRQASRLLINGISANIKDSYGNSALLYAANSGRMDIVSLLLKNHADPNLGTPHGISALQRSGMEHDKIVAAILDFGADPNRVDRRGRTLLAYACTSGRYPELITMLLKHKANPNTIGENGPPLVSLIESGDESQIGSVNALLAAGANPNARDSASTPVLVWSAEQSSAGIVKLLMKAGAKLSETDALGRTALDVACSQERLEIVKLLLDRGADPNMKDHDGNTSVMYAVSGVVDAPSSVSDDSASILRMLSEHGAKLDRTNGYGQTPLQFAADLGLGHIRL